jgi:microcystin degradation protein MlrC
MPNIAIARLGHEGNSFASIKATLGDFKNFEWAKGEEAVSFYRGTNTEIGGAVAFFETRPEWQPTYLRCTFATPSGEVTRDTYEELLAELLAGLAEGPPDGSGRWDAVYLGQHGAMQVEGIDHADHDLLIRVREVIGDTPLGASYDLHANITQPQIDLCDIVVGYKCHPHTDMAETAQKCLSLLLKRVAGKIHPVGVVRPMNALLPSINARTTDGPMAEAAAFARGLAEGAGLLDLTIYQGYAYGDRPHAGASVVAYADGDDAAAERAVNATLRELRRIRDRLFIAMPTAPGGMARALGIARQGQGPVAVIDSADYPGAGANADTPGLLRAVLDARPDVPTVMAFFWDPATVAKATEAGIGGEIEVALGGRLTPDFGGPVTARARVTRLTDGRIVNTGPFCNGLAFDYGQTAVLDIEGIQVIVTETCLTVTDPSFFDLHGIDLSRIGILAIKAKNQFRAAFTSVFPTMIDVDVPGPAAYDFASLPFRRVPQTHFPFTRDA